jgi:hypothetical protein
MSAESLNPLREAEPKPGFFATFTLGLKVWAREMSRLVTRQAKRHEARQLEARLREETVLLARLDKAPGPERDLCLRQIEMLKCEITRLRREEETARPGPSHREQGRP